MSSAIQTQPQSINEATALLKKSATSVSLTDSIRSTNSLSELNIIAPINSYSIKRHKKRICCNTSRNFRVYDSEKEDLLLTVHQDSACWTNDYEDLLVYDVQDQLIFSVEYEERTGYLSTLMKFSVVSSTKLGVGFVSRIWSFMESPRYEISNWDGEHLFSIGRPKVSGIPSYDYKRQYEIMSNHGRPAAKITQEGRTVTLHFETSEVLHLREKTLILALGFILDLLRNEEI